MAAAETFSSIAGLRLDRFLAQKLAGTSRSFVKDLIERGCVSVDGRARPADYRLRENETVSVERPDCAWADLPFDDWILFEDGAMIVLNKPAGLLMHPIGETWLKDPGAAASDTQANVAGLMALKRPAAATLKRCGLVHRLDRETSGALILAKTAAAQDRLLAAFEQREVQKVYRAVVAGGFKGPLEISAPTGRSQGSRKVRVTPWGREALTHVKALGAGRGATLVEARPKTGRTHQIRAHLAYVGHPVLGDPHAKAAGVPPPPRMMLHAYQISLPHPVTGKPVRFTAPVPADLKTYWAQLQSDK